MNASRIQRVERAVSNVPILTIMEFLMPRLPRRFAVAALTLVAMGASAAPALAATPLVKTIDGVSTIGGRDTIILRFNQRFDTHAEDRAGIAALVANAYNCDQAAALVASIPAISYQQTAKAHWLQGVRLQATSDVQYAAGVIQILSGDRTAGFREVQAATNVENRVDGLVGGADETLGVKTLPASAHARTGA